MNDKTLDTVLDELIEKHNLTYFVDDINTAIRNHFNFTNCVEDLRTLNLTSFKIDDFTGLKSLLLKSLQNWEINNTLHNNPTITGMVNDSSNRFVWPVHLGMTPWIDRDYPILLSVFAADVMRKGGNNNFTQESYNSQGDVFGSHYIDKQVIRTLPFLFNEKSNIAFFKKQLMNYSVSNFDDFWVKQRIFPFLEKLKAIVEMRPKDAIVEILNLHEDNFVYFPIHAIYKANFDISNLVKFLIERYEKEFFDSRERAIQNNLNPIQVQKDLFTVHKQKYFSQLSTSEVDLPKLLKYEESSYPNMLSTSSNFFEINNFCRIKAAAVFYRLLELNIQNSNSARNTSLTIKQAALLIRLFYGLNIFEHQKEAVLFFASNFRFKDHRGNMQELKYNTIRLSPIRSELETILEIFKKL